MTLRQRTLLITGLTTIGLSVILYLSARYFLLRNYAALAE